MNGQTRTKLCLNKHTIIMGKVFIGFIKWYVVCDNWSRLLFDSYNALLLYLMYLNNFNSYPISPLPTLSSIIIHGKRAAADQTAWTVSPDKRQRNRPTKQQQQRTMWLANIIFKIRYVYLCLIFGLDAIANDAEPFSRFFLTNRSIWQMTMTRTMSPWLIV